MAAAQPAAAGRATAAPDRATRVLLAQYRKAQHENMLFLPDPDDMHVCYVLVCGLGYPYVGAEILLKLTCGPDFPLKPPELRCLTPNGVYEVGGKICISVGEFHAGDRVGKMAGAAAGDWGWRPTMGLLGFAREALNGILVPESLNLSKHPDHGKGGLGILDTPAAERQRCAYSSHAYNAARNPTLQARFLAHAAANDSEAGRALLRQTALTRLCEAKSAADTTRAEFAEAFGPELLAWCDASPHLAGHAPVQCRDGLRKCTNAGGGAVPDAYLRAYLLAAAGAPAACWEELRGYIPSLGADKLGRLPEDPRDRARRLCEYVVADARKDFARRDAAL